jgi:rhodanese-related sulfurtransferase
MPKKYHGEPYNRITAKELYALSKTEEIRIIDVRELSEYNSGHILESKLISLNNIEDWVKDNEIHDKTAFVCQVGVRSALACEIAAAYGSLEDNLFNLDGGVNEWIKEGFELK